MLQLLLAAGTDIDSARNLIVMDLLKEIFTLTEIQGSF